MHAAPPRFGVLRACLEPPAAWCRLAKLGFPAQAGSGWDDMESQEELQMARSEGSDDVMFRFDVLCPTPAPPCSRRRDSDPCDPVLGCAAPG